MRAVGREQGREAIQRTMSSDMAAARREPQAAPPESSVASPNRLGIIAGAMANREVTPEALVAIRNSERQYCRKAGYPVMDNDTARAAAAPARNPAATRQRRQRRKSNRTGSAVCILRMAKPRQIPARRGQPFCSAAKAAQ